MPVRPIGTENKRRQLLAEVRAEMAPGVSAESTGIAVNLDGKWIWGVSRFGGPTTPKVPKDTFVDHIDG